MTELICTDVAKSFGGVTALDGVDLEVHDGEIVGLIGSNGAGKSTLLNCVTGALEMDTGRVEFDGQDISNLSEVKRVHEGLVRMFQEVRIYEGMTVLDNVLASVDHGQESPTELFTGYPNEVYERARELLEQIDLWERREEIAGELNYGYRKLLELTMVLMTDPELLLLDEPAAGLNPTTRKELREYLEEVLADRPMLVIEHNMEFIMGISDRMYVLNNGTILAEGTPKEIQENEEVREAYLGGA